MNWLYTLQYACREEGEGRPTDAIDGMCARWNAFIKMQLQTVRMTRIKWNAAWLASVMMATATSTIAVHIIWANKISIFVSTIWWRSSKTLFRCMPMHIHPLSSPFNVDERRITFVAINDNNRCANVFLKIECSCATQHGCRCPLMIITLVMLERALMGYTFCSAGTFSAGPQVLQWRSLHIWYGIYASQMEVGYLSANNESSYDHNHFERKVERIQSSWNVSIHSNRYRLRMYWM